MRLYMVTLLWQKQDRVDFGTKVCTAVSTYAIWAKSEGDAFNTTYEKNKPNYEDFGLESKSVSDITELASKTPQP